MHLREAIKRCNESEKNSTLLKACGKGDCFREPQKEAIPEEWNNLLAISTVLLEKCSGAFPWTIRVPQPWHYWHSGPSNSLWGVILSTDRMLTSIPALYLLNARSTPCPPRIQTVTSTGVGGVGSAPFENHWPGSDFSKLYSGYILT